jgi:hypothetical protein
MEAESTAEVTLVPAYGECKLRSGEEEFTAHVEPGSCFYAFAIDQVAEKSHLFHGTVEVDCEEVEDAIAVGITFLGEEYECLSIESQQPGGVVSYTREGEGSGRDLALDAAAADIAYTREGLCGEGSFENAAYEGEATLVGEDVEEAPVGIWLGEEPGGFHSSVDGMTFLTGEAVTTQTLLTTLGSFTCNTLGVKEGVIAGGEADEVTFEPAYEGCAGLGLAVHVRTNSCAYVLTSTTFETTGPESEESHARLGIECGEPEDEIEYNITFLGERPCMEVPPQVPALDGLVYANGTSEGSGDITVLATVGGITYTEVAKALCNGGNEAITGHDGTYSGEITLSGHDEEESPVDIWY